jgi:hypothetical protein
MVAVYVSVINDERLRARMKYMIGTMFAMLALALGCLISAKAYTAARPWV